MYGLDNGWSTDGDLWVLIDSGEDKSSCLAWNSNWARRDRPERFYILC